MHVALFRLLLQHSKASASTYDVFVTEYLIFTGWEGRLELFNGRCGYCDQLPGI